MSRPQIIAAVGFFAFAADGLPSDLIGSPDAGGCRTTSANYSMDGSLGAIGTAAPAGAFVCRPGFIGQLVEVTNLTVTAAPGSVNEGGMVQMSGLAGLDDATVTAVEGSNIFWSTPSYPVNGVGPNGVATAALVYADASGVVTGRYLGVPGSVVIQVLDVNPDNFGLYAGDQIPDGWQVTHFGVDNPNGHASATNATGQNNLYAYVADLNPADPDSRFEIAAVSNQPPSKVVYFAVASPDRAYRLLYSTNLVGATWTNLPGAGWVQGVPQQMFLSDSNSTPLRFYRVQVKVP